MNELNFKDLDPWEQLFFRVHICVSLGEDPDDHGLTYEEINFLTYMLYDSKLSATITDFGDVLFPLGYHRPVRLREGRWTLV